MSKITLLIFLFLICSIWVAHTQDKTSELNINGANISVNKNTILQIETDSVKISPSTVWSGGGMVLLSGSTPQVFVSGYNAKAPFLFPIITGSFEINNPTFVQLNGDLLVDSVFVLSKGKFIFNNQIVNMAGGVQATAGAISSNGSSALLIGSNQPTIPMNIQFDNNNDKTTNQLDSLVLQGGNLQLSNKLYIADTGNITINNGTITTNNNLELLSDSRGTARIGVGNRLGGYMNGGAYINRYVPVNNSYILVTAPIESPAPTIQNSWQLNTFIFGNGNGFDPGGSYNSMLTYSPNITPFPWQSISSTTIPLNREQPYLLKVINRNNSNMSDTLRVLATPTQGTQTFVINQNNFAVIPNPYMSPIDFNAVYTNNVGLIKQSFKLYDPAIGDANNLTGGFVTSIWNEENNNYDIAPLSNVASPIIQPGSAFFVEPINDGFLDILETNKTTGNSNIPFQGGQTNVNNLPISSYDSKIRVNLLGFNNNRSSGPTSILDGVLIVSNPIYSNDVDKNDALKLPNMQNNIAFLKNNTLLAIDRIPTPALTDTIPLLLNVANTGGFYQLQSISQNFGYINLTPYVLDKNSNTTYQLSDGIPLLNTVQIGPNDANRFAIVFQPAGSYINIILKGSINNNLNGVQLNWTISTEINIVQYSLQKSINGVWTTINTQNPIANDGSTQTYQFSDANIQNNNIYRVLATVTNRIPTPPTPILSNTLEILSKGGSYMQASPNPIVNNFNLQLVNIPPDIYTVVLTDLLGNEQTIGEVIVSKASTIYNFPMYLKNYITSGTYFISLRLNGNITNYSTQILKNNR